MTAWLTDTLLYTGLLIALVLVLRRPVGRWFGPQVAYALWALPLLRLLLPPIVLPASLAPAPESAAVVDAAPAAAAAEPAAQWIALASSAPLEIASAEAVVPAWQWADFGAVAVSIWLGVALAFLAWRIVTYRRMRRELLAEARPVGEVGRIRLVETPALAAPVAFGVHDKVIALPPLFMAQPDLAARDLAIAHELAHHRGHDLLANYAAQVLLALHWFNPLAWLGWRAMRRDQEAACDARVLTGRDRHERALYAALIADIAAGPRLALAAPMACPVLGEKSIVHRLRSLSMGDIAPRRRRLGRGLVMAGALMLPATASISYAAASAQLPERPAPAPSAPLAALAPSVSVRPETALAPEAPKAEPMVRASALTEDRPVAAPRPPRAPEFSWHGNPLDPEFEIEMETFSSDMEQFGRDMEKWGEEWGKQWAEQRGRKWSEQERAQARARADRQRAEALARAQEQRVQALARAQEQRAEAHARAEEQRAQALARAEEQKRAQALAGLRSARATIARNRAVSEDVQREVLEDLDEEIARIERERG